MGLPLGSHTEFQGARLSPMPYLMIETEDQVPISVSQEDFGGPLPMGDLAFVRSELRQNKRLKKRMGTLLHKRIVEGIR